MELTERQTEKERQRGRQRERHTHTHRERKHAARETGRANQHVLCVFLLCPAARGTHRFPTWCAPTRPAATRVWAF